MIHTSDWHVGKVFTAVGDGVMSLLQQARLDAIGRIGELAVAEQVGAVLVAGDIYDKQSPSAKTLAQPLEAMRRFPGVTWHLIPGNHDPDLPGGLWQRVLDLGLPENVHLHREAAPIALDDRTWLLPSPLRQKHHLDDPTAWMDEAATPEGHRRIGLAHGSISDFGSTSATPNLIAPDRAKKAGLDYLALGDWHGTKSIGAETWYSGTPEPDGFGRSDDSGAQGDPIKSGQVLLVDIEGHRKPKVIPKTTGRFTWLRERASLNDEEDIARLEQRFRTASPDLSRLLLRLEVDGMLSLEEHEVFERTIAETGLAAALCFLDLKRDHLVLRPSDDELGRLTDDRVIRNAIRELQVMAEDETSPERQAASRAVQQLYLACHRRRQDAAA